MIQLKLDSRTKSWMLTAGTVCLVVWLGWIFFIQKDVGALRKLQEEKKTELIKKGIRSNIDALKKEIQSYGNDHIRSTDIDWLIEAVSQMTRECHVKLTTVSPREPTAFKFGRNIPLEINFQAGFHSLGRFVSLLENHPKRIDISRLSIRELNQKTGAEPVLDASMTLKLFLFENKADLKK